METKHTKGEWISDIRTGCCAVYPKHRENDTNGSHFDDDRNIFYTTKSAKYNGNNWEISEEQIANAKLIAAAPELLEACLKAINIVKLWVASDLYVEASNIGEMQALKEMENLINNAIKKATT